MVTVNRQITLASRPIGFPEVSDFRLVYSTMPPLLSGEVLVRLIYMSLDPYMRCRMSDRGSPPVDLGGMMPCGAVGFVVDSENSGFVAHDAVEGMLGWQEYAIVQGQELRKLDLRLAPISTALSVLGIPGLKAYFGLLDVCDPQRGETVVVSGAAGGVGMIAGQLAKIRGCRVVGVAGSDSKVSWLMDELGFDAALNFTTSVDLNGKLEELCPDGIDVYFDSVGGPVTDSVVRLIGPGSRIAVCGQTSQCNLERPEAGPRWMSEVIVRGAKVQRFHVSDYAHRFPEGLAQLAIWLKEGKLKYREDVAHGIESAPQAFIGMLHGMNEGKQLVQLTETQSSRPVPNAVDGLGDSS